MSKCDKLLEKAKNSTSNLSFTDACYLAECHGFEYKRTTGSHFIYEHPNLLAEHNRNLNFQNVKGRAKPYQIRQLLKAIEFLQYEE